MSFTQNMANWTYSNWRSLTGAAKLQALASHLQEVSDRITENYSIAGRSKGVDPLNAYLKAMEDQYAMLGGNTPRTAPGSTFVPAWGCEREACV